MCGLLNSCHVPGRWTSSQREGQVRVPHCLSQDHGHKGPWQWVLGHLKGLNLVPATVTFDWLDPSTISLYSQCPSRGYTVTHLTREEIQPPETGAIRLRARGLALPLHCLKKELQARPRNCCLKGHPAGIAHLATRAAFQHQMLSCAATFWHLLSTAGGLRALSRSILGRLPKSWRATITQRVLTWGLIWQE